MPINPSIILGLRQSEYKAPDPIEQYGKAQTLKALMTQGEVQDLQAQQLRQGIADEDAVRDAYRTSGGDPTRLRSILQGGGQYKAIQALDKADLEKRAKEAQIGKDEADAKKKAFDTAITRLQHGSAVLGTARDQATYDTALQIMARDFGPEAVAGMPKVFNPQEVQASIARGLTRAQQLEDQRKVEDAKERNRHNLQAERAQMISAGAAASNAQTARDRLAFDRDQPRGVIHQTNDGTFLVDPRNATAQPVVGPDGKPVAGKPLKDIPASVVSGMMENNRSLTKINDAIAGITGNQSQVPPGMTADKDATGYRGYLPNFVLNRVDPKGTDTRALIADIGSLKIHDRSGAAVTASESPRLMPFIPLATDDSETIVKKLNNFKREYTLMQQEMGDYYSSANGFKPYTPARPTANGTKFLGFE